MSVPLNGSWYFTIYECNEEVNDFFPSPPLTPPLSPPPSTLPPSSSSIGPLVVQYILGLNFFFFSPSTFFHNLWFNITVLFAFIVNTVVRASAEPNQVNYLEMLWVWALSPLPPCFISTLFHYPYLAITMMLRFHSYFIAELNFITLFFLY